MRDEDLVHRAGQRLIHGKFAGLELFKQRVAGLLEQAVQALDLAIAIAIDGILVVMLLFAVRGSWWGAFLVTVFAFALGNLNLWHYFSVALGVPPEDAKADAEGIEHYVSPATLAAFARFLSK